MAIKRNFWNILSLRFIDSSSSKSEDTKIHSFGHKTILIGCLLSWDNLCIDLCYTWTDKYSIFKIPKCLIILAYYEHKLLYFDGNETFYWWIDKKELIELQIVNDQVTLPSAMTCNQLVSSKSNKKLIYANFIQLEWLLWL